MTKPDANAPDPGTNPDDAAWLDLVSRLEHGDRELPRSTGNEGNGSTRPFSDFDPLGLSGTAPMEPSAAERQLAADDPRNKADADPSKPGGPGTMRWKTRIMVSYQRSRRALPGSIP
ncbi:hypothetical protein ACW0JT_20295 [Arthrobacter sp. SA17]